MNMSRSEMLANILVGGFGALGQGSLLAHNLDCYPFKILMSPPGRFYSSVGLALSFVAPALSLLALRTFRATRPPFVTAIPVVACPLLFFVLFRIVFALSGYQYASHGSDLIATPAIENGFVNLVLWLTLLGLLVGSTCGLVLRFVFRYLRVR
jgi:hypothetical protein